MNCNNCKDSIEKGEYCKPCQNIIDILTPYFEPIVERRTKQKAKRMKEYLQRPEVKERINSKRKERYKTDPEYRKKLKEHTNNWRKNNPDKILKKYYVKNREKILSKKKVSNSK